MYYANFILNKKGPLAKIWLAAHWDKKLTKAQIYETNIESTIEAILEPQMKLALRTSGHLLLGICRIYSRKVKYLLADCNEAFVKIKLAFRPGLIDLPKEKQQAAAEAITLPEKFPEMSAFAEINMDAAMMDVELALGTKSMGSLATQMARVEDITLKEDMYGGGAMVTMQDDDFGDMGLSAQSLGMMSAGDTFMFSDIERGRHMADSMLIRNGVDAVADAAAAAENDKSDLQKSNLKEISAMELGELESNLENRTTEKAPEDTIMQDMAEIENNDIDMSGKPPVVPTLFDEQPTVNNAEEAAPTAAADKEDEAVAVAANTVAATTAVERQLRTRRRQRKLIVDDIKEIDSATMKAQLGDTSSILGTLELAPPTRQLMLLKEIGGVEKLFSMTGRLVHNKTIAKLYTRNMVTKSLADITNMSMREKALHHKSGDDHSKHPLPLVDSYIDAAGGGDASRLSNFGGAGRDEDFENYGGPASVYNNQNMNDLLENPAMQAEVTPVKHKPDTISESESESDEGDENKLAKSKSSQKKRSYRKSLNLSQKDQATLRGVTDFDMDEEAGGADADPNKNLTKRAKTMVSLLNKNFNKQDNVSFFELIRRNGKKSVVQKFYSLLVLKKHEIIDVAQVETYGDIIISKGDKFDTITLS